MKLPRRPGKLVTESRVGVRMKESLMTNVQRAALLLLTLVTAIAMEGASTPSTGVTVDCSKGQSLNQTLAKLDKTTPTTVSVSGTCTEYVQVVGFRGLILKGLSGATLVQPSTSGGTLFNAVLCIESSNSVIVSGLNVTAGTTVAGIGIGHGSSDIRLRYLTVTGGSEGIAVFENSQASIAFVQAQVPGICHARHLRLVRRARRAQPIHGGERCGLECGHRPRSLTRYAVLHEHFQHAGGNRRVSVFRRRPGYVRTPTIPPEGLRMSPSRTRRGPATTVYKSTAADRSTWRRHGL